MSLGFRGCCLIIPKCGCGLNRSYHLPPPLLVACGVSEVSSSFTVHLHPDHPGFIMSSLWSRCSSQFWSSNYTSHLYHSKPIYWLVAYLPLWKIWVRQLGWWHSQYMENKNVPNHQPVYSYQSSYGVMDQLGYKIHFNLKMTTIHRPWDNRDGCFFFSCQNTEPGGSEHYSPVRTNVIYPLVI